MVYAKHCFSLDDISNINSNYRGERELYREPVMSSSRASLDYRSFDSMLAECESDRESMVGLCDNANSVVQEQDIREVYNGRKVHVVKPVVRVARVVQRCNHFMEKKEEGVMKSRSDSFSKMRRKPVSNV